jgi:ribulose-5-phosphate 4-epimerase/fuculose-1-phosphate aldolase
MLITPPVPLHRLDPADCVRQDLAAEALAAGAPREAWLHVAILRRRPDVRAVCRAQPELAAAMAAAGVGIPALTGHAVLAGAPVPVGPDATLVRDLPAARRAATALGSGSALILPGNGAITVGDSVGAAVARMWLLERAARVTAAATAAGAVTELAEPDVRAWREAADELLSRIWVHLDEHGDLS